MSGISLIVGLGNPGATYAPTRHNAGFRFLQILTDGTDARFAHEGRFRAEIARASYAGRDVTLLMPQTFMNNSGEPVAGFVRYYKFPIDRMLIVHDELDLPPGTVRLKSGGGDGGHNGLHDVIEKLGSADFMRLRIGIGHPGAASQVASYVLRKAPAAEQALIDNAIATAKTHIEDIVQGQFQKAMNLLHTHK